MFSMWEKVSGGMGKVKGRVRVRVKVRGE